MAVAVRVDATGHQAPDLRHAVLAVLSMTRAAPAGTGGQNSDEALVRFLSGHAARTGRPEATIRAAHRGRQVHIPTPDGKLSHRSDPGKTPSGIFTVEPGGVDRQVDQAQVRVGALEPLDARPAGVR